MQIHELTKRNNPALKEGWQDTVDAAKGAVSGAVQTAKTAIANPIRSMTAPKGGASLTSRVQAGKNASAAKVLANKFIDAWHLYAVQMEKGITDPQKKQAFADRTNGAYEKALTAWVQKNLLSGMYLPGLTNKDEILDLISQLSMPRDKPLVAEGRGGRKVSAKRAVPNPSGMSIGGQALDPLDPTDAKIIAAANKQQAGSQATTPLTNFGKGVNMPTAPFTVPGAGTVATPTSPSAPTPSPSATPATATTATATTATPATATTATTATPATPATAPSISGPTLTVPKERDLFTQLVQQAGLSQNTAATGNPSASTQKATRGSVATTGATAQSIAPVVQQAVAGQVNPQQLKAIGQALASFTQNNMNLSSTGQPSVDALLTFMGFTVR